MISGYVTADREAVVRLEVVSGAERQEEVEAVVDTGFTGDLTLPGRTIDALDLPPAGNRRVTLADGSRVVLDLYLAGVSWHEARVQEVLVLRAEGGPLVGMTLLHGNRLTVDIVNGGEVTIEVLP